MTPEISEAQGYTADLAHVYDEVFPDFSKTLAPRIFALYEARAARRSERGAMLDLCCGSGLTARYFAERGVEAYGIDASPAMIEEARAASARMDRAPVFGIGDARDFTLPRRVAFATALYTAMNLLETERGLLAATGSVLRSLEPGGTFVFDIWTEVMLDRVNGESIRDTHQAFQYWRYLPDKARKRSINSVHGFVLDPSTGQYRRYSLVQTMQTYPLDRVREAMLAQGWATVRFTGYDDLERELAVPEETTIVMVVATA